MTKKLKHNTLVVPSDEVRSRGDGARRGFIRGSRACACAPYRRVWPGPATARSGASCALASDDRPPRGRGAARRRMERRRPRRHPNSARPGPRPTRHCLAPRVSCPLPVPAPLHHPHSPSPVPAHNSSEPLTGAPLCCGRRIPIEVLRYGIGAAVEAAYWDSRLLCGLVTPPESPRAARECPPAPARKHHAQKCSRARLGKTRACSFGPRAKSRADGWAPFHMPDSPESGLTSSSPGVDSSRGVIPQASV